VPPAINFTPINVADRLKGYKLPVATPIPQVTTAPWSRIKPKHTVKELQDLQLANGGQWPINYQTGEPMFVRVAGMPGLNQEWSNWSDTYAPTLENLRQTAEDFWGISAKQAAQMDVEQLANVAYAIATDETIDPHSPAATEARYYLDLEDPGGATSGDVLKYVGAVVGVEIANVVKVPGLKQLIEIGDYAGRAVESVVSTGIEYMDSDLKATLEANMPRIAMGGGLSGPGLGTLIDPIYQQADQARVQEFEERRKYINDELAMRDWKDVFNMYSEMGYTLLGKPLESVRQFFNDVDAGMEWDEVLTKHQDVGTELILRTALDPLWLVPATWQARIFPVHAKIGEGIAAGVNVSVKAGRIGILKSLGAVKDFFTESSKLTKWQAHVRQTNDIIGTLVVRAQTLGLARKGTGIDVVGLFSRALSGDEEVLKLLGPNARAYMTEVAGLWRDAGIKDFEHAAKMWGPRGGMWKDPAIVDKIADGDIALQEFMVSQLMSNMRAVQYGVDVSSTKGVLTRFMAYVTQLLRENYLATPAYAAGNTVDNSTKITLMGYSPTALGMTNWDKAEEIMRDFFGTRVNAGVNSSWAEDAIGYTLGQGATTKLPWPIGQPIASIDAAARVTNLLLGTKFRGATAFVEELPTAVTKVDKVLSKLSWSNVVGTILDKSSVIEKTARSSLFVQAAQKDFMTRIVPDVMGIAKRAVTAGTLPQDALNELATTGMTFREIWRWAERWANFKPPANVAAGAAAVTDDIIDVAPVIKPTRWAAYNWADLAGDADEFMKGVAGALDIMEARGATVDDVAELFDNAVAQATKAAAAHNKALQAVTPLDVAGIEFEPGLIAQVAEFEGDLGAEAVALNARRKAAWTKWWADPQRVHDRITNNRVAFPLTPMYKQAVDQARNAYAQALLTGDTAALRTAIMQIHDDIDATAARVIEAGIEAADNPKQIETLNQYAVVLRDFLNDHFTFEDRKFELEWRVKAGQLSRLEADREIQRLMHAMTERLEGRLNPDVPRGNLLAGWADAVYEGKDYPFVFDGVNASIVPGGQVVIATNAPAPKELKQWAQDVIDAGLSPHSRVLVMYPTGPFMGSLAGLADPLSRTTVQLVKNGQRWGRTSLKDVLTSLWTEEEISKNLDLMARPDAVHGIRLGWKGRFENGEWIFSDSGSHPATAASTINDTLLTVMPDGLHIHLANETDRPLDAVKWLLDAGVDASQPIRLDVYLSGSKVSEAPTLGDLYKELSGAVPPVQPEFPKEFRWGNPLGDSTPEEIKAAQARGFFINWAATDRWPRTADDIARAHELVREAQQLALERIRSMMEWEMSEQGLKETIDASNGQLARVLEALDGWHKSVKSKMTAAAVPVPSKFVPSAGAGATAGATVTVDPKVVQRILQTWLAGAERSAAYGAVIVEKTLFNYWQNSRAMEVLGYVFPFTKWQLRNPKLWAELFAKRPALLAASLRTRVMTERLRDQQGLTSRFSDMMPMPVLNALAELGVLPYGYWAWDPMQLLSIYGQFNEPLTTDEEQQLTGWQRAAKDVLNVTESVGLTPWPWWRAVGDKLGLYPGEQASPPLGAITRYPPLGTALDRAMRAQANEGQVDQMQVYRINRRLAEMLAEGTITEQQALSARDNPTHPMWKQAEAEVNRVRDIASGIRALEPFRLGYASVGEQKIRADLREFQQLTDPLARARYVESHPWLNAYWATMDDPLQRKYDQRRTQLMDEYNKVLKLLMPWDPRRSEVYRARTEAMDQLEKEFRDQGWVPKTYSHDRSPTDILNRLKDMEPKVEQFVITDTSKGVVGEIDWDAYNAALDQFNNSIAQTSARMGYPITADQYDLWRTRFKTPAEQAWMLQQRSINKAWERAYAGGEFKKRLNAEPFEVARRLAPPRDAVTYADEVARRLGRPVAEVRRELEGLPTMPGAGTPRTDLQKLRAEYYALTLAERERFRMRYDIPQHMTVSEWLGTAGEKDIVDMLADLRADPKWLLEPTPRQSFWEELNKAVIVDEAYDDPILGPVLDRGARNVFNFTQDQYAAALAHLKVHYDEFVNIERMADAAKHPDWWKQATTQRAAYQHVITARPDMRKLEIEYFSVDEPQREAWVEANKDQYAKLQQWWRQKNDVKWANPYFTYYYHHDDYVRWFGMEDPSVVATKLAEMAPSWKKAQEDMAAWSEAKAQGKAGAWTPEMQEWFGKRDEKGNPVEAQRSSASLFWEFYYNELPPGNTEWHRALRGQEFYKVVMQLQSYKRADWMTAVPDEVAARALREARVWLQNNPAPPRPDTVDYWTRERGLPVPSRTEEERIVRESRALWNEAQAASDYDSMDMLLKLYGALWGKYMYYNPPYGSYRPKEDSGGVGAPSTGGGGDTPPAPPPPPPPPLPFSVNSKKGFR
jgi:hypothetical protein